MINHVSLQSGSGLGAAASSLWRKAQSALAGSSAPRDEAFLQSNPWPELAQMGRVRSPLDAAQTAVSAPMAPPQASAAASAASAGAGTASAVAGSAVGGPVAAAFTPELKHQLEGVVARLEQKGFRMEQRMTDGTLQGHLKNGEDSGWRFDAQLPSEPGFVVLNCMDDVRVLDGISGIGPAALTQSEREQLTSLEGLYSKGYSQYCAQYHDRIHPAKILNTLRSEYEVYLYPQGAANPNTVKNAEQLHALAFFEGVGSSAPLAQKDRAEMLKAAFDEGLTLHGENGYAVTPHTAYCKGTTQISLDKVSIAIDESQLADPGKVKAHLQQADAAWDKYCAPVFERHHLGFEKDYASKVARMDDSIPVDVRLAVMAGLVEKYKQAMPNQGIFTSEVKPLYEAIRDRAHDSAELVRMAGRLLPRIGKMGRDELIESARTSTSLAAMTPADPAHASALPTLLEKTGSLEGLITCLDAMRGGSIDDIDERASVMLELMDAVPPQDRDLVTEHYRNMTDSEGATLREKADGYLKGLYEQRLVDRAGSGPAFSVEPPAEKKEAGKVESQGDFVIIGGMKVPRRGA